jgi:uncharacterized protein
MKITSTPLDTGFWASWLAVNKDHAIYHQWEQLEASGCIDNFRILAGEKTGFREGWFFADSDAHKWLDAAARVYALAPTPRLKALMNEYIDLLGKCQADDGYLYTYNQIHFPDQRWINLQIEHELYCHGHLIEAGVSHYQATGEKTLLDIAINAADRIVTDFAGKGPAETPGHQEIEIAMLRLYEVTENTAYLEMTRQFLDQRGKQKGFALHIASQFLNVGQREKWVKEHKEKYHQAYPQGKIGRVPPANAVKKPRGALLRWYLGALNGQYFQQHQPLAKQTIPVGHAVRFAYLQTAAAMYARLTGDTVWLPALEKSWQRMVQHRMYITGGIGSLPLMEGFGRDDELDPEFAYAETCAALGSIFWNREMAQLTGEAQYSDLLEWQLYNAALVGMGQNGQCYLYNNPLAVRDGIERRAWYEIPCCPSNLSRTWASLMGYVLSADEEAVTIHQYISSQHTLINEKNGQKTDITIDSALPRAGKVTIRINNPAGHTLKLRNPSWAVNIKIIINQEEIRRASASTAQTLTPQKSEWLSIERDWQDGDVVELFFDLPVRLLHANPQIKDHKDKVTLARGPVVYCLESIDQPGIDIFDVVLDPDTLATEESQLVLGELPAIKAQSTQGQPLTFIPYHAWGNRGPSQMTVWINFGKKYSPCPHWGVVKR